MEPFEWKYETSNTPTIFQKNHAWNSFIYEIYILRT